MKHAFKQFKRFFDNSYTTCSSDTDIRPKFEK